VKPAAFAAAMCLVVCVGDFWLKSAGHGLLIRLGALVPLGAVVYIALVRFFASEQFGVLLSGAIPARLKRDKI